MPDPTEKAGESTDADPTAEPAPVIEESKLNGLESDALQSGAVELGGSRPGQEGTGEGDGEREDEEPVIAPTTRSKTAPFRRQPTPPPTSPLPAAEIKRGVITLSDVHAAKAVLAEKANAHWVKGLGGGQNKEGETIVQFLYKMKAGPGEICRMSDDT